MFVLSEYICIISSYFHFVERFRLKQKKKCTSSLKNMPYNGTFKATLQYLVTLVDLATNAY